MDYDDAVGAAVIDLPTTATKNFFKPKTRVGFDTKIIPIQTTFLCHHHHHCRASAFLMVFAAN
jgi:hypothetical protein